MEQINPSVTKLISFGACVCGSVLTYIVAVALITGNGQIYSPIVKIIYDVIFVWAIVMVIKNTVSPIFSDTALKIGGNLTIWCSVLVFGIALFQAIVIFGLKDSELFGQIYKRNFILLQIINLIFLWSCVCGAVGQDNFSKFWRDFMRNPIYALSYAFGKWTQK